MRRKWKTQSMHAGHHLLKAILNSCGTRLHVLSPDSSVQQTSLNVPSPDSSVQQTSLNVPSPDSSVLYCIYYPCARKINVCDPPHLSEVSLTSLLKAFETRLQTVSMSLHQSLNIVVHSDSGNALVRTTPTWKGVWAPEQTLIMDDLPNFSCHWADFVCVCVCVCVFLSLCRFGLHGVVRCSIQVCMRVSASLIQTPLCLVNTLPS